MIPSKLRQQMGIEEGSEVILEFDQDQLRLFTKQQSRDAARRFVQGKLAGKRSLVDELIADRRKEAKREFAD